ncbi:TPA: hypothetical protein ACH3X3_000146 [Trebouxia sp. C0006]
MEHTKRPCDAEWQSVVLLCCYFSQRIVLLDLKQICELAHYARLTVYKALWTSAPLWTYDNDLNKLNGHISSSEARARKHAMHSSPIAPGVSSQAFIEHVTCSQTFCAARHNNLRCQKRASKAVQKSQFCKREIADELSRCTGFPIQCNAT